MAARTPQLLTPYLSLPRESSLHLLTSVLGASTNWLVLRYLHSSLQQPNEDGAAVVLVSFMRDLGFWKDGARKLGLDLERLTVQKKFAFVDGLSGLFLPPVQKSSKGGGVVIRKPETGIVKEAIMGAVQGVQDVGGVGKTVLVIDQLDLLLATCEDTISAVGLGELVMELRQNVHTVILTLSADIPLVAAQHTPLEVNHAAFLLSVAHQADLTMSLRLLDTGTARDVSGVVRITIGDEMETEAETRLEGKELLYFVGGDGGVKIFERGS